MDVEHVLLSECLPEPRWSWWGTVNEAVKRRFCFPARAHSFVVAPSNQLIVRASETWESMLRSFVIQARMSVSQLLLITEWVVGV